MRVWFHFHPEVWKLPVARHGMETLGSLLEMPQRSAALGSDVPEDEPRVYIGPSDQAPAGAAAVVPVQGWPAWATADLEVARFDGDPLLCPGGDLGPPVSERALPEPWLRSAAFLIGREEEHQDAKRDQWGCYSGFQAHAESKGVLDVPLVNLYALQLGRRIEAWCEKHHKTLERIPRWKDQAKFAVILSHDVDDVTLYSLRGAWRLLQQASSPTSYATRAGLAHMLRTLARGPRRNDPYWNFDRWVAEEERRGFRSTFFFCPPDPRRRHEYDPVYRLSDRLRFEGRGMTVATMLSRLVQRDFEIGLHGSYESYRDGRELIRQKGQVEAAAHGVRGIRQHFLRFDVRGTWTAQEHADFVYDTTLGYNEAIGFRAGIAAPFHPWDSMLGKAHRILELPLTVMDGALFRTLKLDEAKAAERVREHLAGVERAGGLAVLLWHPNAAHEAHFPGWWGSYVQTLEYLATRGAWVTTAGAVADWWLGREARIRPKV